MYTGCASVFQVYGERSDADMTLIAYYLLSHVQFSKVRYNSNASYTGVRLEI